MTSIHYRQGLTRAGSPGATGAWLAAACESQLLLVQLPEVADSEARTQALWSSITSARGIQAVLDELTRGGVSATPPFALLEWEPELGSAPASVRTIIRGDVSLVIRTVDGSTSADASGVSTWLERKYSQVLGCDIEVADAAAAGAKTRALTPALPLVAGMAWASTVTVGAVADADSEAKKTEVAPASTPESSARPADDDTVSEQTVTELTVSAEAAAPAPATPAPAAPEAESSYDYLFGETVFRTVSDAAVREDEPDAEGAAAAPPAEADASDADASDPEAGDHDGHTIASTDIAKLRAARKARASSEPKSESKAAPSVPTPTLSLEMSNGTRESLAQPVLVGRAPSVSKVSGGQIPRLLTIAGPDQDISRNHVQFAVEGGTVVVTDLHSRNGTLVVLPGRSPQQLRQGEPTSVIVGTVIDLGGGVTFTVRED